MLLTGCVSSQFNLATHQQEYTLISTDKEVEMGRRLARRVEEDLALVPDEAVQERLRRLGGRLVEVCDRKELVYHFGAVSDPEVNAFSLPGGYVYVNEGLLNRAANDDELAAVIAHEIAHVAARHAVKRYETGLGAQLLQIASLAAGRQADVARGVGIGVQIARLAYARQDELDADRLAVGYLKAAGFDPKGILSFLAKLHQIEQDAQHRLPRGVARVQYGMTHPFVADRIRAVKERLFGVADYVDYLNTSN